MIRVRVSFDKREELEEAMLVAKKIAEALKDEYVPKPSKKIYWNLRDKESGKKNYGGRIYINLKKRRVKKSRP